MARGSTADDSARRSKVTEDEAIEAARENAGWPGK
jgi:hypothetical protein